MLEGFSWLRENSEAYCVTFAQGLDETELLRRFDGDTSRARLIQQDDWQALEELSLFGNVIRVGQCDGWAFAFEDNGYRGTLPEVLHTISAGTVVVSVFYNVNAHTWFCSAENGTVIANFDPIEAQDQRFFAEASPQVLALLSQAGITPRDAEDEDSEDEEDDSFDFVAAMFALAEAAGVRFDRESIAEKPLLCSCIRTPFSDFIGDLLSRGGDDQTTSRLFDLLDDWTQRKRFLDLLNAWLQRERFPYPHFLNDSGQSEHLRTVAVRILSALQSVQITLPLLKVLGAGKEEVRSVASQVLKILIHFDQLHEQEGARERLLLLASAPEPEVALQATIALGTLGDQRAVEPLLRLLPLYPREREIIHLLGQLRASSAAEPLSSRLNPHDENIDVQRDVIKALEQIEGPRVVERLLPLLYSESQTMAECSFQQALLASLARQGDLRLVEPLLQRLNPHPKSPYSYDFQLRLLEAFGNLGERQVMERLAQVLVLDPSTCDTYERIFQEYLVKTLRQLGDTRAELQVVEASLQRLAAIEIRSGFLRAGFLMTTDNIPPTIQEKENALDTDDRQE